jgi:DNA-binding MarR family transcriptional regulator
MDKETLIQGIIESLAKCQRPGLTASWRKSGLSHAQVGMLYLLHYHNSASVKEAADFLGITKSAVTQLAGPLASKGLLVRQEDPADRRIVRLSLTAKGAQALKSVAKHKFDGLRTALENLNGYEIKNLHNLLQKAASTEAGSKITKL